VAAQPKAQQAEWIHADGEGSQTHATHARGGQHSGSPTTTFSQAREARLEAARFRQQVRHDPGSDDGAEITRFEIDVARSFRTLGNHYPLAARLAYGHRAGWSTTWAGSGAIRRPRARRSTGSSSVNGLFTAARKRPRENYSAGGASVRCSCGSSV
jgi:hypothetical protein